MIFKFNRNPLRLFLWQALLSRTTKVISAATLLQVNSFKHRINLQSLIQSTVLPTFQLISTQDVSFYYQIIINSNFRAAIIRVDMLSHAHVAVDHKQLKFVVNLGITILEPYPLSMTMLD
jgi:hypothetical protein